MEQHSRRDFIKLSGAVSAGFLGLYQFVNLPTLAEAKEELPNNIGYGKLQKDSKGLLKLPKGFSYKIIAKRGQKMDDGLLAPGKPDGMATFEVKDGKIIIVRNHEMQPEWTSEGAFGKNQELLDKVKPEELYDYGRGKKPALGGTTTLVYNEESGEVEKMYLSLAGTTRNCAGGPTPWGSWITCEETVDKAGKDLEQDHGYNFEVPAREEIGIVKPVPLKAMGRMNHEAVAVDPQTGFVYQTEDRHDGLIYRFIPKVKNKLAEGGKLQVLAIKGQPAFDTRNWEKQAMPIGQSYDVEWLDIDNPESPNDDLRYRGFKQGAARFARGEGMWFGENTIYFACTNGGKIKRGQIFKYEPKDENGGKLTLFVEPNNARIVKNCDNLTVSPWGDIITCEDNLRPYLVGVTPKGEFYKLAQNVGFKSEFAGAVFSPSGKTLFVNIQHEGLTLAITGPWKS